MAIRKRGNTWTIDYYDPDGKRIVKGGFKTKKAAKLEEAARLQAKDEGMYYEKARAYTATLKELIAKYEENFQDQASYKTAKRYWLQNFKDHFGEDNLLTSIRYVDLETFRNHLKRKPIKNGGIRTVAAINREIACLRHLFSKGQEWEMVKENPFDKGKSLLSKEDNERLRYLEQAELQTLLDECPKHLKRIVICAVNTGMDRGELLRLKWEQIQKGFIHLGVYKTRPARKVPINGDLEQLFKEIRLEQGPGAKYVFTYASSEDKLKGRAPVRKRKAPAPVPQKIKSIKTAFNAAVSRAGIEDFRFKDLRHTFASHMVMRGATMKELQEIMGHRDMKMTMRYAHLSPEYKKKAVNLLNGLTAPADSTDQETTQEISSSNNLVTFPESSKPPIS